MTPLAKSIYYFSFYLFLAGLALFFVPNVVLPMLALPKTEEIWIRLVGTLTFILGIFFNYTAKKNVVPFFFISMFGRGTFIVAVSLAVVLYHAPLPLFLFAAADLAGLLWTWITYRSEAKPV